MGTPRHGRSNAGSLSACIAFTILLLASASAFAQTDFSTMQVSVGDRVRVTTTDRSTVTGTVKRVTASALDIDGRTFAPEPGLKVERLGDRIWNGAAIGMATGAVLGATVKRTGCTDAVAAGCIWKPALVFGLAGALIDHSINRTRIVFSGEGATTASVGIMVSPESRSIAVRLEF